MIRAFWYYIWIEGEIVDEATALEEKVFRLDLLFLSRKFACCVQSCGVAAVFSLCIIYVQHTDDYLEQGGGTASSRNQYSEFRIVCQKMC